MNKHFEAAKAQKNIYAAWEKSGAFEVDPACASRTPYTIIMPPANVTGRLHLGHALTFTLQDILIRYHRMLGDNVLWQPGTDHAGIATQMVVERQLESEGKRRHDLGRDGFIERVWEWKAESGGTIIEQLKQLGASAAWSRERFTMDAEASAAVTKAFVDLYNDKLIYKAQRLVNWDTKYQTALSDIEVEQRDTQSKFYYIRYPLEDGSGHITIATTRPEMCFGDQAVAVHPEDPRYQALVGKTVLIPLIDRPIPIIADTHCDPELGTGAVKITPAHDFNDFDMGKRHGLTNLTILNPNGTLNEAVPKAYRGLTPAEARILLAEALEQNGFMERVEDKPNRVPYGDRSGVVIEPLLTDQWYVDAPTMAKAAIQAVENKMTTIIPPQWEKVFFEWMNNIEPWCISRQIWWGHPLPVWYGPDGHVFVDLSESAAYEQAYLHYGHHDVMLRQETDVLDTWFSSGLWPLVTLGWPQDTTVLKERYPTSVLVTGFDIIFFWVARMMMMGLHFIGEVPFKDVYLHVLVRDGKGQKMSKSKGNIIDPLEMIDRYGADALRFTLATLAAPGRDIKFTDDKVEASRNFVTKLWNATRYAVMKGGRFDRTFDPHTCQHVLNQWIVTEIVTLVPRVTDALNSYRFHEAAFELYQFCWKTFCDWYVELTKPLVNVEGTRDAIEVQQTMGWVLSQVIRLLHPLMPFLTEEIWKGLGGEGLLITASWPVETGVVFASAQKDMNWIIGVISHLRSLRADVNINQAYLLDVNMRGLSSHQRVLVESSREMLERVGRLKSITFHGEAPANSIHVVFDNVVVDVVLAGAINIPHEIQRLTQEIAHIEKEIVKVNIKINNTEFMAKAPDAIRDEMMGRLTQFQTERSKNEAIRATLTDVLRNAS